MNQHHAKLLIFIKCCDIGTQGLEQKLMDYLRSNQESITLYITDCNLTDLKHFEILLQYLYELPYRVTKDPCFKLMIVFQKYNPQFLDTNKFDVTINLGTNFDGDFNVVVHQSDQQLKFENSKQSVNQYLRGANGGTFDHMHIGHKLLLSLSLLAVSQHLTIGITGEGLLQNKKYKILLQSYKTRVRLVKIFCALFRPDIDLFFSLLSEPAGPTKEGDYQVLILTKETEQSLEYINNLRIKNHLKTMEGYVINLINHDNNDKLSSTQIREYIQNKNKIGDHEYLYLKQQWLNINNDLFWFESTIVDFYSQPQRHYHTLRHILDIFLNLKNPKNQTNIAEAIFFHDLIYYPKLHDNEEKSALLYQEYAKEYSKNPEIVSIFILQTKTHEVDVPFLQEQDLEDLKLFLDLDLLILESDNYKQYAAQIRQEYIHFSDEEYKVGRIAVLQHFLEKEQIYFTRNDNQAKANLAEELKQLQQ